MPYNLCCPLPLNCYWLNFQRFSEETPGSPEETTEAPSRQHGTSQPLKLLLCLATFLITKVAGGWS